MLQILGRTDSPERSARRRGRVVGAIVTVAAMAVAVVPVLTSSATGHGQHSSLAREVPAGQPRPVTKASARTATANPPANVAPNPDFFNSCSGTSYDDSTACVNAAVAAIDNARAQEGLPGLVLPTNWYSLDQDQQLFVLTNLERTVRGLPPLAAMSTALDQAAAAGAADGSDPTPPTGYPWSLWGSNWGGAIGNPLVVVYLWMYDDGPGSSNIDCPATGGSGCWGHRDNVLLNLACQECLMGTGFDPTGWEGYPAWAELLVDTSGAQSLAFTWNQELPYLPGSPGGASMTAPAKAMVATPDGGGYWLASSNGGVFAFGDAQFHDSMAGQPLSAPIVAMASTADGGGYWLVGSDGGIFAFGDAGYYGSMGGHPLNQPIVGMAATRDGHGYWEVASDGGIFAFGDAGYYGSMGGTPLNQPIVGMAATPDGGGYWEVASDGGVFAFGDAQFHGSTGGIALARPIVGMAATPSGAGYWMVASDGGIFSFGDAPYRGSTGGQPLPAPMVAMAAPSNAGYWEASAAGGVYSFDVPFHGSMG
jgi:hypothetical protein